jgi:hypothetical protein
MVRDSGMEYNLYMRVRAITKWILAVCLIAGCQSPGSVVQIKPGIEPNPYIDQPSFSPKSAAANPGKFKATVLDTSVWRDWMPIVERPGPDGGSPLHAKIKLWLDNSAGDTENLSFQAVVVDGKGQSYDLAFHVLPNFRVLPEKILNAYRTCDEDTKKKVIAKYNVIWNGVLKKGESREVEFAVAEGPYLPVGSNVHIEIMWKDLKGDTMVVKTPEVAIERSD